ncbi:hypothetical protein EMIT036CA2_30685 [Chryseobacterium sp. IT-36CA2]
MLKQLSTHQKHPPPKVIWSKLLLSIFGNYIVVLSFPDPEKADQK